jgi:hypothetical protein
MPVFRNASRKSQCKPPDLEWALDEKHVSRSVKVGLNSILAQDGFRPTIDSFVSRAHQLYVEGFRLFNGFLLWHLERGQDLPTINQSFLLHFFNVLKQHKDDPLDFNRVSNEDVNTFMIQEYKPRRPPYLPFVAPQGLGQVSGSLSRTYLTALKNHITSNFPTKLHMYLKHSLKTLISQWNPSADIYNRLANCVLQMVQNIDFVPNDILPNTPADQRTAYWDAVDAVAANLEHLLGIGNAFLLSEEGLEEHWDLAIRPFWRVLQYYEVHQEADVQDIIANVGRGGRKALRKFTLAPISQLQVPYLLIDTDTFYTMLSHSVFRNALPSSLKAFRSNELLHGNNNYRFWWHFVFRINKVTTARRTFAFSLATDGVGVSVNLKRPPDIQQLNDYGYTYDNPSQYVPLEINDTDMIVGIDPGRRFLYTAVRSSVEDQDFPQVLNCSNGRWQTISGARFSKRKADQWIDADENVKNVLLEMPSAKCSTVAQYGEYLEYILEHQDMLLQFYRIRKWRSKAWKVYIMKTKAYNVLCDEIGLRNMNTTIIYGNGGMMFKHNSRGYPSAPSKRLFYELKKRYPRVRLQSEFRTSKLCSNCYESMEDTQLYGVKSCQNCFIEWNRDVNAARNIMNIWYVRNLHGEVPLHFRRTHLIAEPNLFPPPRYTLA